MIQYVLYKSYKREAQHSKTEMKKEKETKASASHSMLQILTKIKKKKKEKMLIKSENSAVFMHALWCRATSITGCHSAG